MTAEKLIISERDKTITPSKLRSIGKIPATVYGKGFTPVSIQFEAHDFQLALARGIRTFKLEGAGISTEAEAKQIQNVNTKNKVLHVEFVVYAPSDAKAVAKKPAAKAPVEAPVVEEVVEAAEAPEAVAIA